jgi:LCP family protein required for cell wall assembly
MLSVPRDLWVNIPGVGYSKINDAYPNGGMDTLQQVIQKNLGVTIDYQVLVNYGAFRDLVNAVGGISIDVQSPDPRGLYDPYTHVELPNGWVSLNGQQALNLARARGDGPGSYGFPSADFDRTQHQRQMALAIKDKASRTSIIANPLKVSEIFDAVGNNVTTDLKADEVESLYTHMKKVDDNSIGSYNVNTLAGPDKNMLVSYYTPGGQDALIPAVGYNNFSQIQAQIQRLMSSD